MNLYLIRHGEIEKRFLKRYIGSSDVGLSEDGRKQAIKLASFFNYILVDAIYVSNLKRAKQTAESIAKKINLKPQVDEKLNEIDFGPWEGKTTEEIEKLTRNQKDCSVITSGGETYLDFVKRVKSFFEEILSLYKNETVIIVAHKGVIREAYKYFMKDESLVVDQRYGCINLINISNGKVKVVFTNKTL